MSFASRSRIGWVSPALAALVLSCALATPGHAIVRYVSPTGSSANTGLSPSSPWSLAKANTSVVAGDVCILLPGSYATAIQPASSGAANGRITFVGDPSNPATVTVPSVALGVGWVTVQGVSATGGASLVFPAQYDSVTRCVLGGLYLAAAKHSMIAGNQINGTIAVMANDGRACFTGTTLDAGCFANSEYDTLRGNAIALGVLEPGARAFQFRGFTRECLIDSNVVTGTFDKRSSTSLDASHALILYNSSRLTFRDNRWTLEATSPHTSQYETWNAFTLRDSTRELLFERDTLLAGLHSSYEIRGFLSASGSFVQSVALNRWSHCVYKMSGYLWNQDALDRCVIENSVIASRGGNALWFMTDVISSQVRHNLIWSSGQAMRWDSPFRGAGNEITSNIVYSQSAGPIGNYGAQTQFAANAVTGFVSDYNVFFTPSYTSVPGDRALMWCCYGGSAPGLGKPWNALNGQDAHSRHGSPQLADSTFLGLNPQLLPGSAAVGAGEGGTDAGPIASGSTVIWTPSDEVPPSAVTNLAAGSIGQTSLVLSWTAPGDDGNAGTAAAYDLRRSTQPITADNFAGATPVSPQPAPLPAGSGQSCQVTGLLASTSYWFALRASDEAGNASGISNVANATTAAAPVPVPDVIPPAAVTNLQFVQGGPALSARVEWTAPGDDSLSGTASRYDLRYATFPITAANFATATAVTDVQAPSVAGTVERYTARNLTANTTYYFALRTADEVLNWSGLSNLPSTRIKSSSSGSGSGSGSGGPGKGNGNGTQSAAPGELTVEAADAHGTRFVLSVRPGDEVRADAYDTAGRRVRNLASGPAGGNRIELEWDLTNDRGERVPPGIYLIRVQSGETQLVRRLAILR